MSQKKQGFVYGALILMLSNVIVKVVNALFKIPLSNAIGDTAMGYFSSAYSIYAMCFLIATAGLPVAISRMIAAARARHNEKEVDTVYRISLLIFLVIGAVGTAVLFFGSDLIATHLVEDPALSLCIKAISPIMFFVCLVSCIRGYFQGGQNMTPTAISQVIEVLGNLVLGLTAGILSSRAGHAPATVAAFTLAGVMLGMVASSLYMAFAKWVAKKDREAGLCDVPCRSRKSLAKELISIAIPITISSSVLSLTSVIDSMMAVNRLGDLVGSVYFDVTSENPVAITLYGAYMAKAVTLFNMPPTIIYPFAISIIPAISSADATADRTKLRRTMDFTFRIVSVICLPCAVGLGVMAKPIIDLLFSSNEAIYLNAGGTAFLSNGVVAPMLTVLACAILFSGLISVSGAMLQASGHEKKSILSTCFGVGAKALLVWVLVGLPKVGHLGIPLSTLACYLVMFLFNMYFLRRYVDYTLSFRKVLLRPLIASALCGAAAGGSFLLMEALLPQKIATILAIGLAVVVYVVALFLLRGFEKEDVLMLPKGELILRLLQKLHLLKA